MSAMPTFFAKLGVKVVPMSSLFIDLPAALLV